jgi:hypothetical protein
MYKEEGKVKETLFCFRSGYRENGCRWYEPPVVCNCLLSRDDTVICLKISEIYERLSVDYDDNCMNQRRLLRMAGKIQRRAYEYCNCRVREAVDFSMCYGYAGDQSAHLSRQKNHC